MSFSAQDNRFMARAIELAALGRYTTSPNPNVGAVLVQQGQIVGEGYHHQAGGPHAEVVALRQAGDQARGADCYVTLEPCSHVGRTPPCAEALVQAGVRRVIIAMQDPNPQVAGRGVAILTAAGIVVELGLMADCARALNPGFLSRMERQRPFVRLKLAASLDGKTALRNGASQWITSEAARADVQLQRAQCCAVLSTAATVLADGARLGVRPEQACQPITKLHDGKVRQPVRVVLDRQQRLTGQEPLFAQSGPIVLVYPQSSSHQPPAGATALRLPCTAAGFELPALMAALAEQQLNLLWVEAGAGLAGSLLQAGLVDELWLYQAARILGDQARSLVSMPELTSLQQAIELRWQDVRLLGTDLRLIAGLEN
ncbi:bifunctional diaminohydroxyphosphoribosylaminopyrimidine deaminase/5-amino-6-(5-phosphoribosylamino)uracil reductase RibD [Alkalimonas delamerensis]|uniref:Riboflavin biosynthesis protein RibD n=1 Tax=Alkalimonas delamerensis TaxID=265981 RepID=A0ABT9GRT0_9GAMM|nr:bifunctional diaminohydroxyphosphoribosylaminopyrimidine deaminase/5-amino-6-(5-phosphoribosylamino)uracil reductase RibD [Alkalimonas delamerensis]MDP4529679.1 bifunctional diaminohydroxyphosphoribosylaminopyrimidine deaminase/5-amino-6-(5-phosphoribosylamino)uracil reductase RibD [Alkalimonas delamerensis]